MTRFKVNGSPVEYLLDPGTPLLWALRDASHLTGAKYGCDDASCGACTVIADGEAVRACTVSITAMEGRFIPTLEALSPARNHPLQQRSEERRVGEECVSTGRSRWARYH